MKKIRVIIYFSILISLIISSKNNSSEKFVGTWKITDVKIENPDELISTYVSQLNIDSASATELVKTAPDNLVQISVTFRPDSTYDFGSDTGHWIYESKSSSIILKGDKNLVLKINNFKDNTIEAVLEQQQPLNVRYNIKMQNTDE